MTAFQAFITTSVIFWVVVFAVLFGVIMVLARRGVFKRAANDAKQTLDQAAKDAANKVADKIGGN